MNRLRKPCQSSVHGPLVPSKIWRKRNRKAHECTDENDLKLNDKWCVVCDVNDDDCVTNMKYKPFELGNFDSAFGFWSFWNSFGETEGMLQRFPPNCNMRILRNGIALSYEDAHLKHGGAWIIECNRQHLSESCDSILYAIVCEAMEEEKAKVMGMIISKHANGLQLKVIVSSHEDGVEAQCRKLLGPAVISCKYEKFLENTVDRTVEIPTVAVRTKLKVKKLKEFRSCKESKVIPAELARFHWDDFFVTPLGAAKDVASSERKTPNGIKAKSRKGRTRNAPKTWQPVSGQIAWPKNQAPRRFNEHEQRVDAADSYVLRLRGLPWGCRKSMVLTFFNELPIIHNDILFTHLQGGRPSGEALVCFPTANEYNKALSCAGKFMEGRYIELFPATSDDWNRQLKRKNFGNGTSQLKRFQPLDQNSFIAFIRGLPYSAHPDDVKDGFFGMEFPCIGVHLTMDNLGRPTGHGYAEFATKSVRDCAVAKKNNTYLTNRYVEVFKSCQDSLTAALRCGQSRNGKILYGRDNKYVLDRIEQVERDNFHQAYPTPLPTEMFEENRRSHTRSVPRMFDEMFFDDRSASSRDYDFYHPHKNEREFVSSSELRMIYEDLYLNEYSSSEGFKNERPFRNAVTGGCDLQPATTYNQNSEFWKKASPAFQNVSPSQTYSSSASSGSESGSRQHTPHTH